MICIQCGAQNEDAISYCRQCGTNLQAVRSALLGIPATSAPLTGVNPRLAPLMLVLGSVFGFLSFAVLFGVIVAIVALGVDPSSRIDPGSILALAALVAIVGTAGIVFVIRMLMKMATSTLGLAEAPKTSTPRSLEAPPAAAALPPVRQPMSVVEHTTANLPNYVRPGRNTAE